MNRGLGILKRVAVALEVALAAAANLEEVEASDGTGEVGVVLVGVLIQEPLVRLVQP